MKIHASAAFLGLLITAGAARAEIYRCTVNGKLVYTDIACGANAAPASLPDINNMSAGPRADLARQHDADAARQAVAVQKARADEAGDYAAKKSAADALRKAVVEGRVVAGMSPEQVQRILNLPSHVDGQGSAHERWTYQNGSERRVIVFKDGVVASETTAKSKRR